VTVLVDGRRVTKPGAVGRRARVVMTNGLVRISLPGYPDQRAGVLLETKVGAGWRAATSTRYGDWTYVGAGVVDPPTNVSLVAVARDQALVRFVFANHVVPAALAGGTAVSYPFEKLVWLRANDRGFYAVVRPLTTLPPRFESEHEIGFGGVFGPASVVAGVGALRTDELATHERLDPAGGVAVASLRRDGTDLVRTLVPLPPAPIIVPAFDAASFGGVYVHRLTSGRYGAYLHVAPAAKSGTPVVVCRAAWRRAPAAVLRELGVARTLVRGCTPPPPETGTMRRRADSQRRPTEETQ
jgi:hypothetical protein